MPDVPCNKGFVIKGAQYAHTGASSLTSCRLFVALSRRWRAIWHPRPLEEDRTSWSLLAELLADPSVSRIGEETVSVQIVLVGLRHCTRIHSDAVVDHPSGEIATAYAAGFLSPQDTILVAYS